MDSLLHRSLAEWSEKPCSSNDFWYLEKFAPVWRRNDSQLWKWTDSVQDKVGEGERVACVVLCCFSVSLSGCSCRRHQRFSHWHSAQPVRPDVEPDRFIYDFLLLVLYAAAAVCLLWMLRCRFLKDSLSCSQVIKCHLYSPGPLGQSASEGFTLEAAPSALQPSNQVRKGRNPGREGSLSLGWADMQRPYTECSRALSRTQPDGPVLAKADQ